MQVKLIFVAMPEKKIACFYSLSRIFCAFLFFIAGIAAYGQLPVLPETDTWNLSSTGIQRLFVRFPQDPVRSEKSVYTGGTLVKGSVYSVYIKEMDWKFELTVLPMSVVPKAKTAALWVEEDSRRSILNYGANVLSDRSCQDKMFIACRRFDLVSPDGLIIKGKSVVYDSYLITIQTSGKQPYFNDGQAEFFLNSLEVPRTNIPLATAATIVPATTNDLSVSRYNWSDVSTPHFDLRMPGKPGEKKFVLRGEGFDIPMESWQYIDKTNNLTFNLSRHEPHDFPADIPAYLEKAIETTVSRQGGSLLLKKWIDNEGIPEIEFVYSVNNDMYKCRYVMYRGALYQLVIRGSKELVLGPVGIYYFENFTLKD